MDALTRVACFFPAQSITSFWIVANLIINNQLQCETQTQSLLIAVIVIFSIFVIFATFTDTYTASNKMKYIVVLMPFYGPACFSLPTDFDKDRVYDHYYLKVRDYIRALTSMTAFLLIVLFINPIAPCLFQSNVPGISRMDPAVMRTVPVLVAIVTALLMMCLGTPRQSLGFQNVEETCPALEGPPLETQMGDNPIYAGNEARGPEPRNSYMSFPPPAASMRGGDESDYEHGHGPVGYPIPINHNHSMPAKHGSIPAHGLMKDPMAGMQISRAGVRASDQHGSDGIPSSRSTQRQDA